MSPAAILERLVELQVPVRVAEDGTIRLPKRFAEDHPEILEEIRGNRDALKVLLSARVSGPYPCVARGEEAGVEVLFCPRCWATRQPSGRILPFDPDRRRRALARLAQRRCMACGFSWWRVDDRGDAACVACQELAAGRAPRPLLEGAAEG